MYSDNFLIYFQEVFFFQIFESKVYSQIIAHKEYSFQ